MKIKICGIFRESDIDYVNEALPDYIGFVFARSRRQVTVKQAERLKKRLDDRIQAVGVFVDEQPEMIQKICEEKIIDLVQLHGIETEEVIEAVKAINIPVIKALKAGDRIPENADYLLFDSSMAGSGQIFDWSKIPAVRQPFFIAGGIDQSNFDQAALYNPFGVDLSSGVETDGFKDREKILRIVGSARARK